MKKMSFTITTTLKDKLALMSKIYMSNRKSGIYPMAVMADRKGFKCSTNETAFNHSKIQFSRIDFLNCRKILIFDIEFAG